MIEILKLAMTLKKNVCVYTCDSEISKFLYGRIIFIDNEFFALYMLTPNGENDGILVKKISCITYVEMDGQYDEKMKKLCPNFDDLISETPIDFENGNALFSIMLEALRTEKPISVELLDSGVDSVIGQVTAVNEKICTVRQIYEYGCDDGIAYVNVPDITQVSYASADNSILLLLMTK